MASRTPAVGVANTITPSPRNTASIFSSELGVDVGILSSFNSQ
jgi:hypothetical protein